MRSLKAHKSKDTSIYPQTNGAAAFRQIVNVGLGHLLANQSAGLASDAEGVHQMRIAVRRLRAALALFQPFLEPHAASLFRGELRRVGRVFGEARDWDVFCLQILPDVLNSERDVGWRDLLLESAGAAQEAAHAATELLAYGLSQNMVARLSFKTLTKRSPRPCHVRPFWQIIPMPAYH